MYIQKHESRSRLKKNNMSTTGPLIDGDDDTASSPVPRANIHRNTVQ